MVLIFGTENEILVKSFSLLPLLLTQACATVATESNVDNIALDGIATKNSETFSSVYDVGIEIDAPVNTVWNVLSDSKNFAKWNSVCTQ